MAVQFPLYEACKAKLAERAGTTVDNLDPLSVVSSLPCVSMSQRLAFALSVSRRDPFVLMRQSLQMCSTSVPALQAIFQPSKPAFQQQVCCSLEGLSALYVAW